MVESGHGPDFIIATGIGSDGRISLVLEHWVEVEMSDAAIEEALA
jgi:hypothetical protein